MQGPRRAERRLLLLACGGLAVLASACTVPSKRTDAPGPSPAPERQLGAPSWAGEPLGWPKLVQVERWLSTEAWRYEPFWRVQGELTLAEGRAVLARQDHAAGELDDEHLGQRIAAARAGFERILEDPAANSSQRTRADNGLRALAGLGGRSEPVAGGFRGVVPRGAWGAEPAAPARMTPVGGAWRRITVHHSAEVPGTRMDGTLADSMAAVRKMQHAHVAQRGYGDIGYHFLIDASGRVFEGRAVAWQGAHAGGDNNRQNLGVCLIGDFEHARPTPAALATLEGLLDELRRAHAIPRGGVVCHRDLKNTLCPGESVAAWVSGYRQGRDPALARVPPATPRARPTAAAAHPAPAAWSASGVVR